MFVVLHTTDFLSRFWKKLAVEDALSDVRAMTLNPIASSCFKHFQTIGTRSLPDKKKMLEFDHKETQSGWTDHKPWKQVCEWQHGAVILQSENAQNPKTGCLSCIDWQFQWFWTNSCHKEDLRNSFMWTSSNGRQIYFWCSEMESMFATSFICVSMEPRRSLHPVCVVTHAVYAPREGLKQLLIDAIVWWWWQQFEIEMPFYEHWVPPLLWTVLGL